jgi:hypothetical protein
VSTETRLVALALPMALWQVLDRERSQRAKSGGLAMTLDGYASQALEAYCATRRRRTRGQETARRVRKVRIRLPEAHWETLLAEALEVSLRMRVALARRRGRPLTAGEDEEDTLEAMARRLMGREVTADD